MAAQQDESEVTLDEIVAEAAELDAAEGAAHWADTAPASYARLTGRPLDVAKVTSGEQCGLCGSACVVSRRIYVGGQFASQHFYCPDCQASARCQPSQWAAWRE